MRKIPKFKIQKFPISFFPQFFQFIGKFLKFEEMECLIQYIKFKMLPALFYVNFPQFIHTWKLVFLNVGLRKYLNGFWQFTKRLEIRIFECCPRLASQFFQFMKKKKIEIFKCWPIDCTFTFLKWFRKLGLLKIGQETSNEQEWMEVESFRTAYLNISLNLVECTFLYFRRVNFKTVKIK